MIDQTAEAMRQKLQQRVQQAAQKSGQLREGETCDPVTGEIFQGRRLQWLEPVRNKDGTGHQLAAGTDYAIRKTLTKDAPMYWAWHARKLLGYSSDVEVARGHCEDHYKGSPA